MLVNDSLYITKNIYTHTDVSQFSLFLYFLYSYIVINLQDWSHTNIGYNLSKPTVSNHPIVNITLKFMLKN